MQLKSAWNYELLVKKTYEDLLRDDAIEVYHRKRYVGKRTGQPYEIDLSFSFRKGGVDFLVLIECKYYGAKVRVNDVTEFAYKIGDIGAQKGILFSTVGFQRGALKVAKGSSIASVKLSQPQVMDFIISSRGECIYLDLAFGDGGNYERLERPPIAYIESTFDQEGDFRILNSCFYDATGKVRRGSFIKFVREPWAKREKSSASITPEITEHANEECHNEEPDSPRPLLDEWQVDLEDAQILEDAAKEWFELRSYRAAAKLCEDALAIREELCDAGDPLIAKTLHILGRIYRADKRVEDTRKTLERALALLDENETSDENSVLPSVLMYLSEIHSNPEENLVAESLLRRCVAVCEGREKWNAHYAIALNNLGRLYLDRQNFIDAEKYLLRAIPLFETVFGKDDARTAKVLDNYARLLSMSGRGVEAATFESRAQKIRSNHSDA